MKFIEAIIERPLLLLVVRICIVCIVVTVGAYWAALS